MRVKPIYLILSLIIIWLSFWLSLSKNGWANEVRLKKEVIMPVYTVRQGENWVSLAEKLQVPLLSLLNRNPDIRALRPGVGLNVPRVPATLGGQGGKAPLNLTPTGGQGPPHPPGGKKGGGGGGQLPIPPRYTPPPGKPFRPYQPPGGGKGAPPPAPIPPPPRPVAPRAPLRLPPRPVFTPRREQTAFRAPAGAMANIPPPQQPQRGAAAYYAPQYGGGYGATAALRAFPGARATATVTPTRRRRSLFGIGGPVMQAGVNVATGRAPVPTATMGGLNIPAALTPGELRSPVWGRGYGVTLAPTATPTSNAAVNSHLFPTTGIWTGQPQAQPGWVSGAGDSSIVDYLVENGILPLVFTASETARLGLTEAELQAAGYEVDQYGNWIRSKFEEQAAPAEGGGGGGGYGGYYGRGGGGGGGGGGYGGYSPGYYAPGEDTRSYSPTGRQYPSARFGLVSWRI